MFSYQLLSVYPLLSVVYCCPKLCKRFKPMTFQLRLNGREDCAKFGEYGGCNPVPNPNTATSDSIVQAVYDDALFVWRMKFSWATSDDFLLRTRTTSHRGIGHWKKTLCWTNLAIKVAVNCHIFGYGMSKNQFNDVGQHGELVHPRHFFYTSLEAVIHSISIRPTVTLSCNHNHVSSLIMINERNSSPTPDPLAAEMPVILPRAAHWNHIIAMFSFVEIIQCSRYARIIILIKFN